MFTILLAVVLYFSLTFAMFIFYLHMTDYDDTLTLSCAFLAAFWPVTALPTLLFVIYLKYFQQNA